MNHIGSPALIPFGMGSGEIGFFFPPGFGTPDVTTRSPPKDIPCNSSAVSCSGRCGDDVHIPCSCDDDCQTYEDCCHDFKDVCNPSSEPLPLSMIRNSDCFETDTGLERFINRCPPGYSNATIRDKCHNDGWDAASTVDRIPVTDKATGLNYRNIFCAVCNGAKSPRGWEARVLCAVFPAVFDTLVARIRAGLCEIRVERPTDVGGRPCVMGAIQSCPNTSSTELAQECLAYTSYIRPVSQPLKIYANIHCYQCNNDLTPPGVCTDTIEVDHQRKDLFFHNQFDMSILIWNQDMKAWGLGFTSLNMRPLTSTLSVCELGDVITSTCPIKIEGEGKTVNMIPFTVEIILCFVPGEQVPILDPEVLNIHDVRTSIYNVSTVSDFVIRGWFKHTHRGITGDGNSLLTLIVFVYFEQCPSMTEMELIAASMSNGLSPYFLNNYPDLEGKLVLHYARQFAIPIIYKSIIQFINSDNFVDTESLIKPVDNYRSGGAPSTTRRTDAAIYLLSMSIGIALSQLIEIRFSLTVLNMCPFIPEMVNH
ncbi:uncharacterized protein LOC125372583 [Haliotis rufescens]|uniref:uncharacterized protein LOC125372583 n=1 Tax=Haliotis rufescens TaxID=6454 RepID=UPI00201F58BE|nr:uncharacterized protein LOC125372583 [Haliotis rufescens]